MALTQTEEGCAQLNFTLFLVQAAPTWAISTTSAAAQGMPLVILDNGYDKYAVSLVLSKKAMAKASITVNSPLDDLRISITSPGSSSDLLIRSMLLAWHLDPDHTVTLQPLGIRSAQLAAFGPGLTDGFVCGAPFLQIAIGLEDVAIDPFEEDILEMRGMIYHCSATTHDTLAKARCAARRHACDDGADVAAQAFFKPTKGFHLFDRLRRSQAIGPIH